MEIDYLREFLVLAETKNYWAASDQLYIGQSTLSKHIQRMEEELGVPLFERTTRRVELTQYGQKLILSARIITEERLRYLQTIEAMKEEENGRMVLGVIPSMVQYRITDLLMEYAKRWPGEIIKSLEGDTYDLKQALRDGRCQMAFLRESDNFPIDPEVFEKVPYMTDQAVVLLPPDHPLAKEESVTLTMLKDENFLMLQETSVLRAMLTDACMKAGFRPKVVFDSQRMDTIFQLVAGGIGISIVMERHSKNASAEIRKVPLKPALQSRIYLCRLRYGKKNIAMKHIVKLTEEMAEYQEEQK